MKKIVAITFNHTGELEDEFVLCRVPVSFRVGRHVLTHPPARVLADLIWGYRKNLNEWPTLEQVQDAIERYQKGDS